jgi:NAD(P)-dependent dehydrogenase (short-subunit alcohol dehydrogenase family)
LPGACDAPGIAARRPPNRSNAEGRRTVSEIMKAGTRPLDGKHVLITGGGKGIGAAIAERFAEEGAVLTLTGRDEAALETTAAPLANAGTAQLDVTDPDAVARVFATAAERSGPILILVNNSGIAFTAPLHRLPFAKVEAMMAVNFYGAFHCTQAALPAMFDAGWGRVVTIASLAGIDAAPYIAGYAASKHAVVGMTKALALEVAAKNITANAICPGYVETDMVKNGIANIMAKTGMDETAAKAQLTKHNPRGELIAPSEVAACAAWLCLPGSESVNGQAIAISGGGRA